MSRLAEELPLLRSLDLSSNRMAFPLTPCDTPVFAALRLLVLNFCRVTWEQVCRDCLTLLFSMPWQACRKNDYHVFMLNWQASQIPGDHIVCRCCCQVKNIEKALPGLEELCLCGNGIDHLEGSLEGFAKLRVSGYNITLTNSCQ